MLHLLATKITLTAHLCISGGNFQADSKVIDVAFVLFVGVAILNIKQSQTEWWCLKIMCPPNGRAYMPAHTHTQLYIRIDERIDKRFHDDRGMASVM